MSIPIGDLRESLPSYDERRKMMARDALASVDGFRTIVAVTYEFLFGMRVCAFCPDCNNGENSIPCQDIFGSSSFAEGGGFGRIDAGYTSIEAQKAKGSLHAHSQLFVQCLHQHTPLVDVLKHVRANGAELVQRYLTYKAHVCRQVYANLDVAEGRVQSLEKEWPEYASSNFLVSRPSYLTARACETTNAGSKDPASSMTSPGALAARPNASDPASSSTSGGAVAVTSKDTTPAPSWTSCGALAARSKAARDWLEQYLSVHAQAVQEHKQRHVHLDLVLRTEGILTRATHARGRLWSAAFGRGTTAAFGRGTTAAFGRGTAAAFGR